MIITKLKLPKIGVNFDEKGFVYCVDGYSDTKIWFHQFMNKSIVLFYKNQNRNYATIINQTKKIFYVKLGLDATEENYTCELYPENTFDTPFGYHGIVTGFFEIK